MARVTSCTCPHPSSSRCFLLFLLVFECNLFTARIIGDIIRFAFLLWMDGSGCSGRRAGLAVIIVAHFATLAASTPRALTFHGASGFVFFDLAHVQFIHLFVFTTAVRRLDYPILRFIRGGTWVPFNKTSCGGTAVELKLCVVWCRQMRCSAGELIFRIVRHMKWIKYYRQRA